MEKVLCKVSWYYGRFSQKHSLLWGCLMHWQRSSSPPGLYALEVNSGRQQHTQISKSTELLMKMKNVSFGLRKKLNGHLGQPNIRPILQVPLRRGFLHLQGTEPMTGPDPTLSSSRIFTFFKGLTFSPFPNQLFFFLTPKPSGSYFFVLVTSFLNSFCAFPVKVYVPSLISLRGQRKHT